MVASAEGACGADQEGNFCGGRDVKLFRFDRSALVDEMLLPAVVDGGPVEVLLEARFEFRDLVLLDEEVSDGTFIPLCLEEVAAEVVKWLLLRHLRLDERAPTCGERARIV